MQLDTKHFEKVMSIVLLLGQIHLIQDNHNYLYDYGKCSKILNTSFSVLKLKSGLEFTKCLSEYQTGKTLIRLLLQKQSDLGLHCLSRPLADK